MAALYPTGPPTSYTTPWDTIQQPRRYIGNLCPRDSKDEFKGR
jgi:hypothetical protein